MRPALPCLGMFVLLLAGCGEPPVTSQPVPPAVPADVDFPLTVRVSQETADGLPIAGVEVQAFVLAEQGQPTLLVPRMVPASTDRQGVARFVFEEPSLVAIRATAPGWTREGQVVRVEEAVTAHGPHQGAGGPVVSERDLFLPLYHADLRLVASTAMMTAIAQPAGNASQQSPMATADLAFLEGLAAPYLARLTAADVRLRWEDTASSRAHVSAALAWDGAPWVQGDAPAPALLPGPREATFSGALPEDGRPDDLSSATLQAAAVLQTAAVGDVPLAFEVRLVFTGIEPPGLPATCHATMCLVPPLPPVRS